MYSVAYYNFIIVSIILVVGIITSLLSNKTRSYNYLKSSFNCLTSAFILVSMSVMILLKGFIADDFRLEYVVMHSSREMPFIYKITGIWAGQEGSILFWLWILLFYGVIMFFIHRRKNLELMPIVNIVFFITAVFFTSLLIFVANPFKVLKEALSNGRGLNPLLQDPGMVFHPPALYLGFVGFTIPFAYAIASLVEGKLDVVWVKITKKWTLLSWLFLSLGIMLGAKWAYIELGWGGYWAWDPVENASLIPWLTSTAYIHSVMAQ
jgi:cytochrome c-type biogenesis protein CcmF